MKAGDARRALLAATLAGGLLLAYLCWKQQKDPPGLPPPDVLDLPVLGTPEKFEKPYRPPLWTYECINQRCERRPASTTSTPVALSTCSMLCGSTQLWPQPTGPVSLGSRAAPFAPSAFDFQPIATGPALALLRQAWRIFNSTVSALAEGRSHLRPGDAIGRFAVVVAVADGKAERLTLGTDEGYSLAVKVKGGEIAANVTARTFFGARHGLETLSQLIWWDEYERCLKVLKGAQVKDAPVFAYRGLMVDTSRNFMSLDVLKRTIVGMAASKLNVFHWHATDSQSFPLQLPSVPQLAKTGAYGPHQVYSEQDVRDLVEFARVRGVRVMIEIDVPAHAGNGWTWGPSENLGDLAVCVNERPWSLYCGEPPCGQLNPSNPRVYDVLEKIYRDLLTLTGERELFHLGGDEVNLECWAQHLQRAGVMANYTDLHDLWGEFTAKAMARLKEANGGRQVENVIMWSSKLSKRPYVTKYLDKERVVRPSSLYCGEPPCGQLNPSNPRVYDVLEKIYRDLLTLTGERELFHLGGDEVNLECWAQHLQRAGVMANYTDLHDLWGEFTAKAMARLKEANGGRHVENVIMWSSKLSKRPYVTKYLDKERVVLQSWGASQWPDTPDLISDGYRVLVSHVDAWYLDCGFGRWRETGDAACDPYRPWQTVYNHRPWQQLRLDRAKIIGGEACVWTEQVNEDSLDARLWPRAAAFAERVWSDPVLDSVTYNIQEDVYTRLDTHRNRLEKRGIRPEALWPAWCSQNPGMCL